MVGANDTKMGSFIDNFKLFLFTTCKLLKTEPSNLAEYISIVYQLQKVK